MKSNGVSLIYGFALFLFASLIDFLSSKILTTINGEVVTGSQAVPFLGLGMSLLLYIVWIRKIGVNTKWFFIGFFLPLIMGLLVLGSVFALIFGGLMF